MYTEQTVHQDYQAIDYNPCHGAAIAQDTNAALFRWQVTWWWGGGLIARVGFYIAYISIA